MNFRTLSNMWEDISINTAEVSTYTAPPLGEVIGITIFLNKGKIGKFTLAADSFSDYSNYIITVGKSLQCSLIVNFANLRNVWWNRRLLLHIVNYLRYLTLRRFLKNSVLFQRDTHESLCRFITMDEIWIRDKYESLHQTRRRMFVWPWKLRGHFWNFRWINFIDYSGATS